MRLLHIITGIPKAAGTSTFCGELCNQLATLGHDVTIAVLNPDASNQYSLNPQIHLVSIKSLIGGEVKVNGQGQERNCHHSTTTTPNYNLIHIHGLWSPILHKVSNWAHSHSIPVVWSTHGMTAPWALKHKWWKKWLPWYLYQKRDLKRAAFIHCTSDFEIAWNNDLGFKRTFLAPLGTFLPEEKGSGVQIDETGNMDVNLSEVTFTSTSKGQKKLPRLVPLTEAVWTVVHHQTTAGSYSPDNDIIANSRSTRKGEVNSVVNLNLQPQPKTLLFVGRIYPVKALDRLIKAFQAVPHSGWKLRLVGPDQAGHLAELKKIAGGDVEFPGPRFGEDLQREYELCDCLALVSHTENFGATIVDAMAHGKPVIASTKTPWKIVSERGCGFWVDNDVETLSAALSELLNLSTSELLLMGANGRKLVEEQFTWGAVARSVQKAYEKV